MILCCLQIPVLRNFRLDIGFEVGRCIGQYLLAEGSGLSIVGMSCRMLTCKRCCEQVAVVGVCFVHFCAFRFGQFALHEFHGQQVSGSVILLTSVGIAREQLTFHVPTALHFINLAVSTLA